MDLTLNTTAPSLMHIDLNSCFATCEQQAYPNLRGRPLVIAAYTTPRGFVLSPSIEAKSLGIKMGMTVGEVRQVYPQVIVRDPDPPLIRSVHLKLKNLLKRYSASVTPKSIDEVVIDFAGTPYMDEDLKEVGKEIKRKIRREIGDWVSCNVGISMNRFLAKLAAGLHKPDGLDVITSFNLREVYKTRTLIDLPGINVNFQARLNAYNIFTPLEFLEAPVTILQHRVFKSILGRQWYQRLRGWEVDNIDFERKSYGQNYALGKQTADQKEIAKLLLRLVEKMGRRLRRANFQARGISLGIIYIDQTYWHKSQKFSSDLATTEELYSKSLWTLQQQPIVKKVRNLSVSCFDLVPSHTQQLELFGEKERRYKIQEAIDSINNKWGEFTVTSLYGIGMKNIILDRIAFGQSKELEEIYN